MINHRLWRELDKVALRYRRYRFWMALSAAWLMAAGAGLVLWLTGLAPGNDARLAVWLLCAVAGLLSVIGVGLARMFAPNYVAIARRIELKYPDLGSCLLAALEQQPSVETGRFGFLQESVIGEALVHADRHPWQDVVPRRRLALAVGTQFAALSLFIASLVAVALGVSHSRTAAASSGGKKPLPASTGYSVVVEPGNTEIERGSSLLVLARLQGAMPAESVLIFDSTTDGSTRLAMSRSLDDPLFGARIGAVAEPIDYHVELDGRATPTYHVGVFEYPRLERADARLVFPRYTGMEEKLVQDFRTVSVVEGTELTIICHLNKRVASATLTEKKVAPLVLAPVDNESADYQVTFRCEESRRLKVELVDDAGRKNVDKPELSIKVVPNKAPTIKPVFPARDFEVSAIEELDVKATFWDDFGLARYGLSYTLGGEPAVDVVIGEHAAGRQRHDAVHKIAFEELHAEPDQLLAYYFWAEDFDRDGNVRRTSSDMYFAEVRHFEEIFRQGEQPPGGEQQQRQQQQGAGQNAQQAQQLAQLQKDIMNATWKLIRREIGEQPTKAFTTDAKEIAESQASAQEQAEALAGNVRDSESLEHVAVVLDSMTKAVTHLTTAHTEPSTKALQPALAAEQAAYQGLLKLRAREHQVVRQQRQQSQSASASASARSQQQRQQLDQLEMNRDENRYETQRQARSEPEQAADRENRQVLNRLKELARRQHDLNERLKDLQSALQEAATAEKREEIRRQLKRLEEEQTQMLRDTDELASRIETAENQERMSDERQQLEQTREQVRRTSEALEQEQVTQAAASGTRAEREFEELRNEFRRRASGRFNDEMRDLRESARELDRREKELAEKLNPSTPAEATQQKSLRDDGRAEQVAQGIAEQRQRLGSLTDRMKQTIQEAEQTEPLLTERLYETARTAQDQNLDRSLEATGRSVRQGLLDDARQQERVAGRGIEKLREGVEKAAEAVLGDETEALRRAREELQNLSRELNDEVARNSADGRRPRDPRGQSQSREQGQQQPGEVAQEGSSEGQRQPGQRSGERGQQTDQEGQQSQPGQGQPGERRPGQQQRGRGQRGQRQAGEQQPGESQSGAGEPGEGQPGEGQRGQGQRGERSGTGQQPGQSPGRGRSGEPGRGESQGDEPQTGERQPGAGERAGQQPGEPQAGGQRGGNRQGQPGQQRGGPGAQAGNRRGGAADRQNGPGGPGIDQGGNRQFAPLSGGDYLDWSDRLRDVEEMVDDPELRAEAARIRDRARSIRAEFKRHSIAPNWDLVRMQVAEPLVELTDRVAEELLRRNSRQAVVPLDRDPVPPRYSEKTRRYYEQLGSGR